MLMYPKYRITLACLFLLLAALNYGERPIMAEPISWMERYALSADRETALEELIPGSDDYFFYHCLYYQTSGQLERSESFLRDWLARHRGVETSAIVAMTDRQRLLTYQDSPQRTIDYLVNRLGIELSHAPPATKNERRFPSTLDGASLDVDRLVQEALNQNDQLKPLGEQFLAKQFLQDNAAGKYISLREFLDRLNGPYIDHLDTLIIRELVGRRPNEQKFGDLRAHQFLTLDELRAIAEAVPQIADDDTLVHQTLLRMRPGGDSDASQQPAVQIDYLTRVEAYVQGLPPSYDSLKASAAYRLLEANLQRGVFDRELFLRYLQLPRVSPIVHQDWSRRFGRRVQLGDDFMRIAMLPPIGDEQPLVRTYLEHFLRTADDPSEFAPYLKPDYLRQVFAETKLLNGTGNEQRWYKMLSDSQRQEIRDAVELRLTHDNPRRFDAEEPTALNLNVKNVDELVVRIYKINSQAYYRSNEKRIDTDIDLDGLVATHERKLNYNQPAVQRHRERLELHELSGRGIWVVDLVGPGVRARALVRRGSIDYVASTGAAGMVFHVIDEHRKPVSGATMWVGAREFSADERGRIVLPPVADVVTRRAILSDGEIAIQVQFKHLREQYHLNAGMHVDRTQLQSGGQTELLIRPQLRMGRTVIDPGRLKRVSVRIESRDLEELPTSYQVDELELDQNAELKLPIRVPPRLASLSVTLSGVVDGLADSRERPLSVTRTWNIAGIRATSQTHDAFLSCDGDDFIVEVRGRNGELVEGATVSIRLRPNVRTKIVQKTLQTDERGQVRLGPLAGMTDIRYGVAGGLQHNQSLQLNQVRWPDEVHSTPERSIQLPLQEQGIDLDERYRLLEIRDGGVYSDQTERLADADGLLLIEGLSPGDFQLLDRMTGTKTAIVIVDGPVIGSVVAGQVRHRSISPAVPIGIESITRNDGGMQIKLAGDSSAARVHVYASRYLDRARPIEALSLPLPSLRGRRVRLPTAGYVSDLRLGEEYQYVLRRRYAKKYPGVMLPQPSLILNPWETEETTNESQAVVGGDAPPPTSMAEPAMPAERMRRDAESKSAARSSDYDFLADSGVIIANLRPNAEGIISVPATLIEGLPLIQVVACDAATMLQRTVKLPNGAIETTDLRLGNSLAIDTPYSFERGVLIASPDEPLELKKLGTAQLQVYSSVGDLLKLYRTLINDPRLDEFETLGKWHTLDQKKKLAAYSKLASHELHLFLWSHDRTFFDEVILPYMRNKKEKQFLDHWLLGNDLSSYLSVWNYNQLNAAERALLAIKFPEARSVVRRQLREVVASQQEDHTRVRFLLESALKASDVDFTLERRAAGQIRLDGVMQMELSDEDFEADQLFGSPQQSLRRSNLRREEAEKLSESLQKHKARNGMGMMFGGIGGMMGGGGLADPFFRELDTTKQWAESQWDRVRTVGGSLSDLIDDDAYWADLAESELDAMRISTHLLRPIENRHAALMALATCGLPLAAGDVSLPTESDADYRPEHAVAVVTKRLKELTGEAGESSILIGQRVSAADQEQETPGEPSAELNEFLTGVAYRGQVVVSNPTATQKIADVFWQLPEGSLPLSSSQTTDSRTVTLKPFAVEALEYHFYFPADGMYPQYPATVSVGDELAAQAEARNFSVVQQPSEPSTLTWDMVARTGSAANIESFLADANLQELDWTRITHRMQDRPVYDVVIEVLDKAKLPMDVLWGYGFKHHDEKAMRTYLSLREDLVGRVGPVLRGPLLAVDPVERNNLELLEYAPLVRARIHRLGDHDQILNSTFLAQYERFVEMLAYSSETSAEDKQLLAYYLLIQNRISEAIETFDQIDRDRVATQLQYDYLDAYLAMHREQFDHAERVARAHASHKIPRWNQRFSELLSQLRQRRDLNETEKLVSVESQQKPSAIPDSSGDLSVIDRESRQAEASKQQPEVIVRVEGDTLRIDHRQTDQAALHFYGVDLELLFSKAPFVREDLQRMAMVRPTRSEAIQFDSVNGVARFDLDGNLRRQTLLVEVVSGASRSTALYYGGDITTYVSESYGQLQTTDANSHRPISAAYVKVYARYGDGDIRFYKDGYTDARGRFDYAILSAGDARGAERYAILVMSDEKGATLHEVAAPNQ